MPVQSRTPNGRARQLPQLLPRRLDDPREHSREISQGNLQENLQEGPFTADSSTRKKRESVIAACETCRKKKVKVGLFHLAEQFRKMQQSANHVMC